MLAGLVRFANRCGEWMEEITGLILKEGWWNFIWKPVAHFVLSGGVGLLVYWWTSTTLQRSFSGAIGTQNSPMRGFGIHRFSFYLALAFAVFVHILEDYTINLF